MLNSPMLHLVNTAFAAILAVSLLASPATLHAAETCTTQARMQPPVRDAIAAAASAVSLDIQSGNESALRTASIPELQADFSSVSALAAATAPHLRGSTPQVEQLYLLDASTLAKSAAGANPDSQFFCTLNQSSAEADFTIPQLPPGVYAFAMVRFDAAVPFRLSMLLRRGGAAQADAQAAQWRLAGLYPKPLAAMGHEGVWFWTQSRALVSEHYPWTAWLYLQEAQSLLQPASFVSSTHLEKLAAEIATDTPPALAGGLSPDSPYVVKASDGSEFRVTSLSVDDSLGPDKLDISAHIKADAMGDPNTARKRNLDAATALIAAHPELRKYFHGVLIATDVPNSTPFATEVAMAEIR